MSSDLRLPSRRRVRESRNPPPRHRVSLLERLKADDAAAWDRLISLYAPLVYRWCRRLDLPEQDIADSSRTSFRRWLPTSRPSARRGRRYVSRLAPDDRAAQGAGPFPKLGREPGGTSETHKKPPPTLKPNMMQRRKARWAIDEETRPACRER